MITRIPYNTLGHANHGWLDARHHFSFSSYMDRNRMGFGTLRVINDDRVAAGAGFGAHPHDNMEIITYVRSGAITHEDNLGNVGRTAAGDVQVMSAGTGVVHAEFNRESEDTTLYQIWIYPRERDVAPRWEARQFPKKPVTDQLAVLVSGLPEHNGSEALMIHQDAAIYGGRLNQGTSITHAVKHQAYLLVSEGSITVNGQTLEKGDGAAVVDEKTLTIVATSDSEMLVIDVPARH